jgi:hypothetical protein
VGAPEGKYGFKMLNDSLQPVLTGSGDASVRSFVTTLSAHVDTRRLSPGHYTFYFRQPDTEWQSFPVVLH